MDNKKLAELLFPTIDKVTEDYKNMYPKRDLPSGAPVTRLGPSPTGFIHLGNLYGAFVDERIAHLNEGIFYLRLEDTDDKRYVEGSIEAIIDSLGFFGITFDEGINKNGESGKYGPYAQSQRGHIYKVFVKELVEKGVAYPCFMNEEVISEIREAQEKNKLTPGIYGQYAKCRDLTFEEVEAKINNGDEYVIRLKSQGNSEIDKENQSDYFTIVDGIRGEISMPRNFQDVVILKKIGLPTYHFAHVVDDYLMRTTHVVRGEEWLASLPIHIELFEALELEKPIYCHTAVLMKLDENGNKKKLSKRNDPELALSFYKEKGYHYKAVREYLLTILNSNFEEWRIENPDLPIDDFNFTFEKMSKAGALFDLNKLNDVSKDVILTIDNENLATFLLEWAKEFDETTFNLLSNNRKTLLEALSLGRDGDKPRKDFIYASQIIEFISYFFDETFKIEEDLPENISPDDAKEIFNRYLSLYDEDDNQEQWFNKVKELGEELKYAKKPKDYKKNPDQFKGHVGHVSTAIRIAIMGRSQSPDLWEIQQILGKEKVFSRINSYLNELS